MFESGKEGERMKFRMFKHTGLVGLTLLTLVLFAAKLFLRLRGKMTKYIKEKLLIPKDSR